VSLGSAGVRTDTPGVLRGIGFAGEEKISACSCGAAGRSGLEDSASSRSLVRAVVPGVLIALVGALTLVPGG
jgi:hypothetical protein